jgi:hypothetical protein
MNAKSNIAYLLDKLDFISDSREAAKLTRHFRVIAQM